VSGIQCLCMHGSPGFSSNLETTVILVRVARSYLIVGVLGVVTKVCSFNRAVLCTLGKVGKPGMALKDKQLMSVQHVHNGKDMYVWLPTGMSLPFLCHLYSPHIHFGMAEVANPLHRLRSLWFHVV